VRTWHLVLVSAGADLALAWVLLALGQALIAALLLALAVVAGAFALVLRKRGA
jgi:hypothetical protein